MNHDFAFLNNSPSVLCSRGLDLVLTKVPSIQSKYLHLLFVDDHTYCTSTLPCFCVAVILDTYTSVIDT